MENQKLTQEELQTLQELQQQRQAVIVELGSLELTQMELDNKREEIETFYSELKAKEQEYGKTLSEKYGNGSIDLEKGEFTPS